MKKIITVAIFLSLVIGAAKAEKMYCTGDYVNERTEPNTKSNIVSRHKRGETIEVESRSGDWYKLSNGNWMSAQYLATEKNSSYTYLYISGDVVNERKEPTIDSKIIGHHKFGEKLKVVETNNGWSKINNGGWIKSEYLTTVEKIYSDIIIIDISSQKATYYQNGEKLKSASIVTGDNTPIGCFTVTGKTTNTTLMNDVHVDYFVTFKRDIGIHDASWRNEFGGEIYKNHGSHGCVNAPSNFAKFVYENCTVGKTVILVN